MAHTLTLDHVAFAWDDLDDVRTALDRLGLPADYGGVHGDGTTHMAVVGFADGSYLELVAVTDGTEPAAAGFWPAHVESRAGPAGWCVGVESVASEAKAAIDAGLPVEGPHEASRERPDGVRVEWDMAFQGDDERYPFVIADRTPRSYRVTPTEGVGDGPLSGVAEVVLAVDSLDEAAERFRRRYRFPSPVPVDTSFADDVVTVPGQPVTLATDRDGPLTERVDRLGDGPCAYLLGTDDVAAARERYDLTDPTTWGVGDDAWQVLWFDDDRFRGRLGVVRRPVATR